MSAPAPLYCSHPAWQHLWNRFKCPNNSEKYGLSQQFQNVNPNVRFSTPRGQSLNGDFKKRSV